MDLVKVAELDPKANVTVLDLSTEPSHLPQPGSRPFGMCSQFCWCGKKCQRDGGHTGVHFCPNEHRF